ERLATDHQHAKKIGEALQNHPLVKIVLPVETNLVIFELIDGKDPKAFITSMRQQEILLLTISNKRLRIVTHLDISPAMVDHFLEILVQTH
ncbi:MAG TPA: hypothetical protein VK622_15130, partial [Puia sp.]|nr:hypothetical protein [Puia sp.]